MTHTDCKGQASHLRREIHNYIGSLPSELARGQADASDCALRIGKLLVWIAGILDQHEPPGAHHLSALSLGKDFQKVGLALMDAKAKGRLPNANGETLVMLRTIIDDLKQLERSVSHVLS